MRFRRRWLQCSARQIGTGASFIFYSREHFGPRGRRAGNRNRFGNGAPTHEVDSMLRRTLRERETNATREMKNPVEGRRNPSRGKLKLGEIIDMKEKKRKRSAALTLWAMHQIEKVGAGLFQNLVVRDHPLGTGPATAAPAAWPPHHCGARQCRLAPAGARE